MTDTDPGTTFFMEAFSDAHRDDPHRLYDRMRQIGPAIDAGTNMWLLFGHADCWNVVRSATASSDERRGTMFQREAQQNERLRAMRDRQPSLLLLDPPDHTRLRKLVAYAFTPRRLDVMHQRIIELTNEMLDAMAATAAREGSVDVIEGIAYPLPIAVISELLGVPLRDHEQFRAWSAVVARSADPGMLRSEEENAEIDRVDSELATYFDELIVMRAKNRGNDLLSEMIDARDGDEQLTSAEIVGLAKLLLVAGHETTVGLIGNGLDALLCNRDQLAVWRDHPSITSNAVDELLRYDSPVQMVQRIALEPLTLGDCEVPAGDQLICMLSAANHDPAVFDAPDQLRLDRPNANRHVAFGGGIHHCLGAALAKMEATIVLGQLIDRFGTIEPAGEPTHRKNFNLRGRATLPVMLGT